jgi:hypothetical protein
VVGALPMSGAVTAVAESDEPFPVCGRYAACAVWMSRSFSWLSRTSPATVMRPIVQGHRVTRRSALNRMISRAWARSPRPRVPCWSLL